MCALSRKGIPRPAGAGIVKRKRRRFRYTMPKKVARKPGFDAFTVKGEIEDEDGNKIEKIEVVAPETGIHSLAWSLAIVPQPGTLLDLPYEIRQKIYTYCLLADSVEQPVIRPQKHGKKFVSTANLLVLPRYNTLSLISRQTYVDIIGGGTMYSVTKLCFNSPTLMTNYLSCINPAHKALIRTISLRIRITRAQPSIARKVFRTLAALMSLRHLEIELSIDKDICEPAEGYGWYSFGRKGVLNHKVLMDIKTSKYWAMIKGLRSFLLLFTGWPDPSISSLATFKKDHEPYNEAAKAISKTLMSS